MEVDGVDKKDYWKVVDQCYLCDVCYMTKCPYMPPHPWNVDFPHLMLRAKAVKFKKGEVRFRDKFLSNTDALGTFAGIPIVTQTVNAVNKTKPARSMMEKRDRRRQGRMAAGIRREKIPLRRSGVEGLSGQGRRAHAGQGRGVFDLLCELQRAGHRPRPARDPRPQRNSVRAGRKRGMLRHAEAGAGRSGRALRKRRRSTSRTWRNWRKKAMRS